MCSDDYLRQVNEIKPHVQSHPEHHPWLANYLVVKRICTQPNFHDLYLELVNQLEVRVTTWCYSRWHSTATALLCGLEVAGWSHLDLEVF